jgi:hypothetical protein
MNNLETKALEDWVNRCKFETHCSEYNKLDYACNCKVEQKNCVLYHLFNVGVINNDRYKK